LGKILVMHNKKGFIFITSLAVMLIASTFGLTFLFMTKKAAQTNINSLDVLKAFYHAEAGVEAMISKIMLCDDESVTSCTDIPGFAEVNIDGNYSVSIVPEGIGILWPPAIITSIGKAGSASRTIVAGVQTYPFIPSAIQVMGNIQFPDSSQGTIFGDVVAGGTIKLGNTQHTDEKKPGEYFNIPNANFASYIADAQASSSDAIYFYPGDVTLPLPQWPVQWIFKVWPQGVHVIDGDLTIDIVGIQYLLGGIVVKGTLTIQNGPGGMAIAPGNQAKYSLIVGDDLNINTPDVVLGKLVYVGGNVIIDVGGAFQQNPGNLVVKGNLTLARGDMRIRQDNIDSNPNNFSGGVGKVESVGWQGHPDPVNIGLGDTSSNTSL